MSRSFSSLELVCSRSTHRISHHRCRCQAKYSKSLLCPHLGIFQERFLGTIISLKLTSCPWRSANFPARAPLAEAAQFRPAVSRPLATAMTCSPTLACCPSNKAFSKVLHALAWLAPKNVPSESVAASSQAMYFSRLMSSELGLLQECLVGVCSFVVN